MQGNKGGPAIALSLMKQLNKYLESPQYVFSVPRGKAFLYEQSWAARYHVTVVEDYSYADILPGLNLRNNSTPLKRLKRWIKECLSADLWIEMTAISYVGPPIARTRNTLLGKRFRYFLTSIMHNKPYLAWTQSYGPFSNMLVKFLAKLDLARQPIIFCRGATTLEKVKEILPDKKLYSFPDVAVVLNYDAEWAKNYVRKIFDTQNINNFISLSPSSVLYAMTHGNGFENKHILDMIDIIGHLLSNSHPVCLAPHTLRVHHSDPKKCDYAVSKIIKDHFRDEPRVILINDDLSPVELKSIISLAKVHLGGRYHSIIAALSAGVPSLSLSWHYKYDDVMEQFGLNEYIYLENDSSDSTHLIQLTDKLLEEEKTIRKNLIKKQEEFNTLIDKNTKLFLNTSCLKGRD